MTATLESEISDLDAETKNDVDQILTTWRGKEGNLIMILHAIQDKYGFVPREIALYVADEMGINMARIYEVITFYHYFKLVAPGKHNMMVCNGTACYLKGSPQIIEAFEKQLGITDGQTTSDQLFHFETVRCIGCCGMAPALVIDGKTIGRVKPCEIEGLIATIRQAEAAATKEGA